MNINTHILKASLYFLNIHNIQIAINTKHTRDIMDNTYMNRAPSQDLAFERTYYSLNDSGMSMLF